MHIFKENSPLLFPWPKDPIILMGKWCNFKGKDQSYIFFFYNLNFLSLLYKNSIITTHMLLTKILESCMYSRPSSICPRCRESAFKYSTVIVSIIKYIFDFDLGWFIFLLSFYFFLTNPFYNLCLLCVFIWSETLLLWKYKKRTANPH